MNFTILIIFAALNAVLAVAYLLATEKRAKHSLAVYVAAALLLWWPVMIYPIIFASERRAAADPDKRAFASYKLRLAWLTAACSVAIQAVSCLIIGSQGLPIAADDTAQICAVAATFLMTLIMLAAIRLRR